MRLKELFSAGGVEEARGDMDQSITGFSYDSRAVKKGEVFFAVPGARVDGHGFAPEALKQGAAAVVVEKRIRLPEHATWVRVRNVRHTMGRWSASFYSHPSRRMAVVGVTGTNGKTTVTYLLESILSAAGIAAGVIGTINYRYRGRTFPALYTTPESVDLQALLARMVDADVQSVAMEVSSHALELERVRDIEFDGAIFTNLTRDHLDFHRDMKNYFSAKRRLFNDYLSASSKGKKFAVIYGGDSWGVELLRELGARKGSELEIVSYGQGKDWEIHPLAVASDLEGLRGRLLVRGREVGFSSRLIGGANLENIMAAAGAGLALGLPAGAIAEGIARMESVPGRLERIENGLGLTVLVDYAHTPDALERVLSALRPLTRGRLITLFGCGGDRDRGKRPLMGDIAARLSDLVVLTSDNPRTEDPLEILAEVEEGVRATGLKKFEISDLKFENSKLKIQNSKIADGGYFIEPDRRAAVGAALRLGRAGDAVLIAGKGHEDYQILGSKRIAFDDRMVAREELRRLGSWSSVLRQKN